MVREHEPQIKDNKRYEGLRKKGMSKERAARIANRAAAGQDGHQTGEQRSFNENT